MPDRRTHGRTVALALATLLLSMLWLALHAVRPASAQTDESSTTSSSATTVEATGPTITLPTSAPAPSSSSSIKRTTTTARRTTTTTARRTNTTAGSTTVSITSTSNDLLVPGPTNAQTGQAVPSSTIVTRTAVKDSDNAGTVVALVISALLVVALLLAVLTWRYWRNTKPRPHTSDPAPPTVERESVGAGGVR
jgi:cobalamin biosynthesis Mg chelatase CobN